MAICQDLRCARSKTVAAQTENHGLALGEPASDLAALHQGVDIALSLSLLEAVFGRELRHQIAVAVERGQIQPRKLAPLRPDLREDDLLGLGGGLGFCRCRIGSNICHVSISTI
jgi:hypothetical protein